MSMKKPFQQTLSSNKGKFPARSLSASSFTDTPRKANSERNLVSSCYVLPVFKSSHVLDDELEVDKNAISCVDRDKSSKTAASSIRVEYDRVYNDPHEFAKYAYNTNIDPLVKETMEGGSTLAAFGGVTVLPGSNDAEQHQSSHFLSSQTVVQSLVCQAAGQLLNSVNIEGNKTGSVTFSWYRIEANSPEIITDMLKSASLSSQGGASSSGSVHGNGSGNTGHVDNSLLLRELGKGRGMIVPGLWEVEVSSGADVEAVVSHVHRSIPVSEQQVGCSHGIMQLTITNKFKQQAVLLAKSRGAFAGGGGGSGPSLPHGDGPGVGRITFVLLSNINQNGPCPSLPTHPPPSSTSHITHAGHKLTFPWVDHLYTVAHWLENKRASPAFHKSRILLLLRDLFYKRQTASLMLLIKPNKAFHSDNTHWIRLGAKITTSSRAMSGAIIGSGSSVNSAVTTITTPVRGMNRRREEERERERDARDEEDRQSHSPTPRQAYQQSLAMNNPNLNHNSHDNGGCSTYGNERGEGNGSLPLQPPPPPPKSTSSASSAASIASGGSRGYNSSSSSSSSSTAARRSRTPTPGTSSSAANQSQPYVQDFATSEAVAALQVALDASRSECAALKVAYQYATDKYEDIKTNYDSLLLQLKEEGAMLTKRDKERYQSAVKDLKDYEIYKQVMETAMVRLQAEMENVMRDNVELRSSRSSGEKNAIRHKAFSERYTKDLTVTKKKLTETESKTTALERQVKQVTKDRDVAVATLAQVKSVSSQREGQLRMTNDLRQVEADELKKKSLQLEELVKAISIDKQSILTSSSAEVDNLRAAHTKALEMLMGYQEENDLMRAAVSEMTEKQERQEKELLRVGNKSHLPTGIGGIGGIGGVGLGSTDSAEQTF